MQTNPAAEQSPIRLCHWVLFSAVRPCKWTCAVLCSLFYLYSACNPLLQAVANCGSLCFQLEASHYTRLIDRPLTVNSLPCVLIINTLPEQSRQYQPAAPQASSYLITDELLCSVFISILFSFRSLPVLGIFLLFTCILVTNFTFLIIVRISLSFCSDNAAKMVCSR